MDSETLKDHALTQADLVNDLRELLAVFAREHEKPILILIDELDKISLTSDLIETVNDLKDLFHVEGVHFVVSVSTDALLSFEQRGLPARDAFDSSFDIILRIHPLTMDESLQVLSARAAGFPPIIGAFCHAWSGGLPRELLRVARRCVEIQRTRREALSIDTYVRAVVAEDLMAIVEGRLRLPSVTMDDRGALLELRERVRALEKGQSGSGAASESRSRGGSIQGLRIEFPFLKVGRSSNHQTPDPVLDTIKSVVALGEGLTHYFAAADEESWDRWQTPEAEVFEAAALAMSHRGEAEEIRREVFEAAVQRLRGKQ